MDFNEYLAYKNKNKDITNINSVSTDSKMIDNHQSNIVDKILFNSEYTDIKQGSATNTLNKLNKDNTNNIAYQPYMTEDNIQRIKADKQGMLSAFGNAVVQGLTNEVILGFFGGISNLIDAGISPFIEENNDYTNPVSKTIEEWQDIVRNTFAIHKQDPTRTWAYDDAAWWAEGLVNVFTTASMLLPTLTISKGISTLGKATKVGRAVTKGGRTVSYNIGKVGSKLATGSSTAKAARIGKSINSGTAITRDAFFSRTMENYLEARSVYKEIYDDTLKELQSNDFDREEFNKLNPNYANKSDEELAAILASKGADTTFKSDYAMLLMDIMQFKALKSLWKGDFAKRGNGGISTFNKRAAADVGKHKAHLDKVTINDRLKYIKDNPGKAAWDAFKSIEFTEGIEEMYQGIQTEKGKEVAQNILHPDRYNKTIGDYLSDDFIWEQGFWGVIGGMLFKPLAKGTNKAITEVDIAINKKFAKNKYSQKQIDLMRMGYEKAQIEEIKGREILINTFNQKINALDTVDEKGFHRSNYQAEIGKDGNAITDSDGNIIYRSLTEEEYQQEREQTIDNFVAELTMNAIDAGTYDLLDTYLENENVQELLKQSNTDIAIKNKLKQKMDATYNRYENAIYNIYNSLDYVENSIARLMARGIVANETMIDNNTNELNDIIDQINKIAVNDEDKDAYLEQQRRILLKDIYTGIANATNHINARKEIIRQQRFSEEISDNTFNELMGYIKEEEKLILEYAKTHLLNFNSPDINIDNVEDISAELQKFLVENNIEKGNPNNVPNSLKMLLDKQISLEYDILRGEIRRPTTQQQYQNLYRFLERDQNNYVKLRTLAAVESIRKWIQNQENLDMAQEALAEDKVKELKDALDIVKLGHPDDVAYIGTITSEIEAERKRRKQEELDKQIVTNDGEKLSDEEKEKIMPESERKNINNNNPHNNKDEIIEDDSSTGKRTQTDNKKQTDTNDNFNVDDDGQVIDDTIPDIDIEQPDYNSPDAQAAEMLAEDEIIDNDAFAASTAYTVISDMIRDDKNILNILKQGFGTASFEQLIDKIELELLTKGVSKGVARYAATQGVKSIAQNLYNFTKSNEYLQLVAQISNNNNTFANTFSYKYTDVNQAIEAFIEEWCKKNNIELLRTKDGKLKGHTVINTLKLLNNIINDKEIGVETAKYLIRNLRDYLSSNKSKHFLFDNRKIITNLTKPENFAQLLYQIKEYRVEEEVIDDKMHINLPTGENRKTATEILSKLKGNEEVTFTDTGNSISVRVNGIEIGYLGKVNMSADGNTFSLRNPTQGFNFIVTKPNSNNLIDPPTSNLDEFFRNIIYHNSPEYKELYDIAYKYFVWSINRNQTNSSGKSNNLVEGLTEEDIDVIIKSPIIQDLVKKGYFNHYSGNNHIIKFLDTLNNIIFHDINASTSKELWFSYQNYIKEIYNNYVNTKTIEDLRNKHQKPKATIAQIVIKNTGYTRDVRTNVSTMKIAGKTVNSQQNPIIYYTDYQQAVDDNGGIYENNGLFRPGTAGILLSKQGGYPIIAAITDTNLAKNTKLGKAIAEEFTEIINNFNAGKLTFEEVSNMLADLTGGIIDGIGRKGNHFLAGANVIKTNDFCLLNLNDGTRIVFYKMNNKTKERGTGISIIKNNTKQKISSVVQSDSFTKRCVDAIMDNVKFNISFIMPKNKEQNNININRYFGKRNGKFITKLRGQTVEYNNYTDFIFSNNIAITNQVVDNEGNILTTSDVKGVFITPVVKDISNLPVEGNTTTEATTTELIKTATEKNPTSGIEVAQSIGVTTEELDILDGSKYGVPSILPERIIFDNSLKSLAITDKDTVKISKDGLNTIIRNKRNGLSLLLHERLHQLLKEQDTFKQANIVNDLIDTFNRALEVARTIKPRESHYQIAQWLIEQADKNGFNPKDIRGTLENAVTDNNNLSSERIFAEEWLVESLTRPGLSDFLNDIGSEKGDITNNTNDSLWYRIIKSLLEILGIKYKNINNFSILAEQYKIISNIKDDVNANKSSTETSGDKIDVSTKQNSEKTGKDTEEKTDNEENKISESIEDNDIFKDFDPDAIDLNDAFDDIGYDDIDNIEANNRKYIDIERNTGSEEYKNNPTLNSKGVIPFTGTNQFISSFPEIFRKQIKEAINDNYISFICK